MKIIPRVSLTLLATLTAGSLTASELKNKEFGVDTVSPAQRYSQSQGTSGQFALSKDEATITTKSDSSKIEIESQSTKIEAAGLYELPKNAFAGVKVSIDSKKTEISNSTSQSDQTANTQKINPFIGINISDKVALAYELEHQRDKEEGSDEVTSNQHKLGLIYHDKDYEIGGAYSLEVDTDESQIPASLTLHGQATVTEGVSLGAIVKQDKYSMLKSEGEDTTSLKVFTHFQANEMWDLEGALAYQSSVAEDGQSSSGENAGKLTSQVGAYYKVQENLQLGSSIKYEQLTADTDINKLEGSSLGLSIQASYKF